MNQSSMNKNQLILITFRGIQKDGKPIAKFLIDFNRVPNDGLCGLIGNCAYWNPFYTAAAIDEPDG